ncbi:hypothetical protein TNCV_4431251 [Trichonephila clavipes]|nr:hypothetical protein TNCV_4431251 [Trichonephila clavipes]
MIETFLTNRRASFRVALGINISREEMQSEGRRGTLPIGQAARFPLEEQTARRKGGVDREKEQILTRMLPSMNMYNLRQFLSDEAHFWLNGYVNKQNCRMWSEAIPQVYAETSLHPEKLTVWCALWAGGILLQKRGRPQRYSQW